MIVMTVLTVLALIAGIIAFLVCNDLIHLLMRSESALTNVEVLLKMRHDLVPDLLDAMKDHARN
jgi:LemA protein